jgi:hypothetical protein
MIEVLPDMPEGVTGIRVSGRLLGDDLREFKPAMEELLKSGEIRIVEVIASDYEGFGRGGLVEDLKLGFGASSNIIRPQENRRSIRQGTGRAVMRWHGWSPASSPCSASTSSSMPRSGPRLRTATIGAGTASTDVAGSSPDEVQPSWTGFKFDAWSGPVTRHAKG